LYVVSDCISDRQIVNLSRRTAKKEVVRLRLKYDDLAKIPQVIATDPSAPECTGVPLIAF
jgi:hypothetical protein